MGPEVPEPSDADLLRRHVAGDAAAFGLLFQRHKDRLWAVALRTTCDPDDAADALQEAMISAFRRAKDFRGDSAVTTWLHRIVVNASLDRLRRRPARSVSWSGDPEALESMLAQDTRGGPSLAVPSPRAGAGLLPGTPPADPADSVETRLDVAAALRLLPEQQRAALVLVDMLGYPVAEVATILAVSEGTVKSRCARGRARLLPFLAHLRGESGNQTTAEVVQPEQTSGMGDSTQAWGAARPPSPPYPPGRRRMIGQWHPDATAIAEYREGLTDGRRARRLAAHVATCEHCASVNDQLAAVTTALASAPDPALPDTVEHRIMAALATEASLAPGASSATKTPQDTEVAHDTTPLPDRDDRAGARRPGGRRSGPGGHRWLRPAMLASAAAAGLALLGGVYGITHLSTGSSSSSAASSAAGGEAGSGAAGSESSPLAGAQAPVTHLEPAESAPQAAFTVTASGTSYRSATLAEQVRAQLAKPNKTAAQPADEAAPSAQLAGCVLHLTGQARPSLVDRATYEGKPAYVIAVANRAWVVGTGCTASNPELMASVGL